MFSIRLDYPNEDQEVEIVRRTTGAEPGEVSVKLSAEQIQAFQSLVRKVPVSDYVTEYAVRIVRATRPKDNPTDFVRNYVSWGAGPRASQFLVLGAKARAALRGEPTPAHEDVRAVAYAVLRHRIVTNFNADAEGISTDNVISHILETVPADPPSGG